MTCVSSGSCQGNTVHRGTGRGPGRDPVVSEQTTLEGPPVSGGTVSPWGKDIRMWTLLVLSSLGLWVRCRSVC